VFFAVVLHHPSEANQTVMFVFVLQPYWIVMRANDSGNDRVIRVWRETIGGMRMKFSYTPLHASFLPELALWSNWKQVERCKNVLILLSGNHYSLDYPDAVNAMTVNDVSIVDVSPVLSPWITSGACLDNNSGD
jgi:hypothetical protein